MEATGKRSIGIHNWGETCNKRKLRKCIICEICSKVEKEHTESLNIMSLSQELMKIILRVNNMVASFYIIGDTSRDRILGGMFSGSNPIFNQDISHFMPGNKYSIWIEA